MTERITGYLILKSVDNDATDDIETRIRLFSSLAEFSVYEKEVRDIADNIIFNVLLHYKIIQKFRRNN